MYLHLFSRLIYECNNGAIESISSDIRASMLATRSGELLGVSRAFMYWVYNEWKDGQETKVIECKRKGEIINDDSGWFDFDGRGSYERRFLLDEEDLKVKFKGWMRRICII